MNNEVKDRIKWELSLISNGERTELIENPDAVIYRSLPSLLENTDVLVLVPNGYPGAMLDFTFLPEGSPLLQILKGNPQDIIEAEERKWQRVSYHPHNGGGGPVWNPTLHGFHTYIDEVLTWLSIPKP